MNDFTFYTKKKVILWPTIVVFHNHLRNLGIHFKTFYLVKAGRAVDVKITRSADVPMRNLPLNAAAMLLPCDKPVRNQRTQQEDEFLRDTMQWLPVLFYTKSIR